MRAHIRDVVSSYVPGASIGDVPLDTPVDSCERCLESPDPDDRSEINAATTFRDDLCLCDECAAEHDDSVRAQAADR